MKEKLSKRLAFLIFFIFLANLLAMKYHWYYSLPWFDMPMHFLGGLFIGLLSLTVYFFYFTKEISTRQIFVVSVLGTLGVALAWELFEFSIDTFITLKFQDIYDTLSDLSYGLAGGFIAAFYFTGFIKKFPNKI